MRVADIINCARFLFNRKPEIMFNKLNGESNMYTTGDKSYSWK